MSSSQNEISPEQKRLLDGFRSSTLAVIPPDLMPLVDVAALEIRNTLESMQLPITDEHTLYAITVAGISMATNMRKLIEGGADPRHAEETQMMGLAGLGVKIDDKREFGISL